MYDTINEITFKISPYCNLDCEYCFQKHDVKTKHTYFDKYDELVEFLKKLPIGPKFEVKLTGGETSLYPDQIRLAYKKIKKLERYKDTTIRFTTISNGTNMKALIDLFDDGILDPWGTKISWDGIYSASKSRKPKNKTYNDDYFNDQIALLGASDYKDKVLVRTALTINTVNDLYASYIFSVLNGCTKWEYYYLTDAEYYRDKEFNTIFNNQLNDIFIDLQARLLAGEDIIVTNIEYIRFVRSLVADNDHNKLRAISCRHLGTSLYVGLDGKLYPCGYFTEDAVFDDCKMAIGDIYNGFDKSILLDFCKEYSKIPMCFKKDSECTCYQCFECPAVAKYRNKHMQYKLLQACSLRECENALYTYYTTKNKMLNFNDNSIVDSFTYAHNWKISKELNLDLPFNLS